MERAAQRSRIEQEKIALLQGTLDLLILRTLRLGPAHGHAIVKAIETVIATTKLRTPDLGGKAKTSEMGKAIAEAI